MYSNALNNETAHMMWGVPGSNFCRHVALLNQVFVTSSIIQPPHHAGEKCL
jgi:hypothetical protein